MAFFDRFKRKQQSVLPEEVSQYYQSQKRERTGVALMLGFVALLVTLLIGAGLFFGGRYVYRKISNNDKPATTVPATQDTKPSDSKPNEANQGTASDTDVTPPPATTPTPGSSNVAPSPSPQNPQPQTPSTGDNPALPRTGDEGR